MCDQGPLTATLSRLKIGVDNPTLSVHEVAM
jgi:hypothetical protein